MMQPTQPIVHDARGVERFQANSIIEYLFQHRLLDLNQLALMDFPDEDRCQIAQLLGYSISGYGDLSYVSDENYARVTAGRTTDDPTP